MIRGEGEANGIIAIIIIAPPSHASKHEKRRGVGEWEYRRGEGDVKGSIEEFEVRRTGFLTTEGSCDTVS